MVDPLSLIPLHVETFYDNKKDGKLHTKVKIADATAFVFAKGWKEYYLVTNWHVLSGRHPETRKPLSKTGAIPNIINIWFHGHGESLMWLNSSFPLIDWETDERLWKEHKRGSEIDVAILPLTGILLFKLYPLDPVLFDTNMDISPSEPVSIVGFPFGLPSSGVLPIWKTGNVASDIDQDYDGRPVFLIDANTKPGMSGSPVIARRPKWSKSKTSDIVSIISEADKFLGVYSGRISKKYDSGIGMVWKPELINEIIEGSDNIVPKIVRYAVKDSKLLWRNRARAMNYLKKIPGLKHPRLSSDLK